MIVPAVVPAFTVTLSVNVLTEPGATLGFEQLIDPVVVQVHPVGTGVKLTKVVLFGNGSVKVAVPQLLGPLLVTTCVYVIVPPTAICVGLPLLVTARSQTVATFVTTLVLLFVV